MTRYSTQNRQRSKRKQIANLDFDGVREQEERGSTSLDQFNPIDDGPISTWKDCEVRLDLAVVYMNMGNIAGTHDLLAEILKNGDSAQIAEANNLLKKRG